MCDFAVGLSRQLNGLIIPSERELNFNIAICKLMLVMILIYEVQETIIHFFVL